LRLSEYLSVPYLLEAQTVEIAPGSWVRRVAYPELPDCHAQALVVEEALLALERLRIETIVRMVGEGSPPPVPRPEPWSRLPPERRPLPRSVSRSRARARQPRSRPQRPPATLRRTRTPRRPER